MVKEERKRRRSPEETTSRKYKRESDRSKYKRESSPRSERRNSKYSNGKYDYNDRKSDIKKEIKSESHQSKCMVDELKQKEIMYQAKMAIQERMRLINFPNSNSNSNFKNSSILRPEEASAFIDLQMDKVNRFNELKNRLAGRLSSSLVKAPVAALDHIITQNVAEKLKVKAESPPPFEPTTIKNESELRGRYEPEPILEFLDPRIKAKNAGRPRRNCFSFKEKGEYEKLANLQRSKAKLEILQTEISRVAKHTGISSAVKLAIVTPSGTDSFENHVPNVEWWDEILLGQGKTYDYIPLKDLSADQRYSETITELVEHPIQLKPPDESTQPQYLKACLTKKERKKLRRQNRREVLKEKMEKVRLGLEPPPEPKVKIGNLMRVLGNDAIQDPTKMEAHVRKQIADRLKKHAQDNEDRKLSREQRAHKAMRKIAEDTSFAVYVAVYKIKSLANPSKKFKVHINAKQLQMTGILLLLDDINVIVVEGGLKQQKFYKNLLMNRIKWSDEIAGQKKEISRTKNEDGERNECTLIWEGIVQRRSFGEPKFILANNHKHAREILDKHGVPHYWDLCYSTSVLLSTDE